jgi:hypothetical protein
MQLDMSPMTTTLKLSDELGSVLVGRMPAADLRKRIEGLARAGQIIVLDFENVVVMSPSFADEVFARLDPSLVDSGHVVFENLDNDLLQVASFLRRARHPS